MTPLGLNDINRPYIEVFERPDNLWDWRLVAGNGQIVCASYVGYADRASTEMAVDNAREFLSLATEVRRA